ncbi:hypothetical protein Dimus_039417 [Dionaea muscipula]
MKRLGKILGIPCIGFAEYAKGDWPTFEDGKTLEITRFFLGNDEAAEPRSIRKIEMALEHRQLFVLVIKCLLPRQERRWAANFLDLALMYHMAKSLPINLPLLIIHHMNRVIAKKQANHSIPYGFLLTRIFQYFKVPLRSGLPSKQLNNLVISKQTQHRGTAHATPGAVPASGIELSSQIEQLRQELQAESHLQTTRFNKLQKEIQQIRDSLEMIHSILAHSDD